MSGLNRFHETPVLAFDLSIASQPKRCVADVSCTLLCQEVRESKGVERRTVVRLNRMRYPVTAEVSIHTLNNGVGNSRLDDVDFVKTAVVVNQHEYVLMSELLTVQDQWRIPVPLLEYQ